MAGVGKGGIRIGASVVLKRDGAAFAGLSEMLRGAAESAGEAAAAEARRLAPVRTGRLRDSVGCTVEVREDGSVQAAVGTDVPYAAAVELGTAKRPGRHFLESGMAAAGEALKR